MIDISITKDGELIKRVFTNPMIWKKISCDGMIANDFFPANGDNLLYCHIKKDEATAGIYLLELKNSILCEIHTAILPEFWGKSAYEFGEEIQKFAYSIGIRKIVTLVPEMNRIAFRYAEKLGMTVYGTIPSSILQCGKLQDQILMGKELCQQQFL
jgi:RimJ/RimL family protein N-acetyltransferase